METLILYIVGIGIPVISLLVVKIIKKIFSIDLSKELLDKKDAKTKSTKAADKENPKQRTLF